MDRLASMKVFERVATEGGFAAAARALDLSPAAVTRLVADLESHLGTRLLQRSTRRVSLTEAGDAYLARVRGILQDVEEAEGAARASTAELSGTLRIHAQPAIASYALAPMIPSFRLAHPGIELDIEVDTVSPPPIEDHDLTFLGTDERFDAGIVARRLVDMESVLVATPAYLARRGTPRTPADLASHECLRARLPGVRRNAWRLWPDRGARAPIELAVRPVLWVNSFETLLHAVLAGAGVTAVPTSLVAPHLARGELSRVLAPWHAGVASIYAALPSRRYVPRRTRAFLDHVVERTRAAAAEADAAASAPSPPAASPAPR